MPKNRESRSYPDQRKMSLVSTHNKIRGEIAGERGVDRRQMLWLRKIREGTASSRTFKN